MTTAFHQSAISLTLLTLSQCLGSQFSVKYRHTYTYMLSIKVQFICVVLPGEVGLHIRLQLLHIKNNSITITIIIVMTQTSAALVIQSCKYVNHSSYTYLCVSATVSLCQTRVPVSQRERRPPTSDTRTRVAARQSLIYSVTCEAGWQSLEHISYLCGSVTPGMEVLQCVLITSPLTYHSPPALHTVVHSHTHSNITQ